VADSHILGRKSPGPAGSNSAFSSAFRMTGMMNFYHAAVVRMCHLAANMALQDEPISASRVCKKYDAEMTHLSDLPSFVGRAAVRIFRCYICDNVVLEDY
jgi:hypothetical protein